MGELNEDIEGSGKQTAMDKTYKENRRGEVNKESMENRRGR